LGAITAIIRAIPPYSRSKAMSVITGEVQVLDAIGLHARPASQIVKLVKDSGLEVLIGKPGEEGAKANSALRLLALKVATGETLVVQVPTDDQALATNMISEIQEILKGE
jgi:phosphotransferase system HPr (HPr) family protein